MSTQLYYMSERSKLYVTGDIQIVFHFLMRRNEMPQHKVVSLHLSAQFISVRAYTQRRVKRSAELDQSVYTMA